MGPREAQEVAPFTVFVPALVPTDWRLHCTYVAASERPPRPPSVSLHYRSDSGHEGVSVRQSPADDTNPARDHAAANDGWEDVLRDGVAMRVRSAGGQAQLVCERNGTGVLMTSETLRVSQLQNLAAMLVPVASAGDSCLMS